MKKERGSILFQENHNEFLVTKYLFFAVALPAQCKCSLLALTRNTIKTYTTFII